MACAAAGLVVVRAAPALVASVGADRCRNDAVHVARRIRAWAALPAAATGPVSATLGAADHAYWAHASSSPNSAVLTNKAQGFAATFTAARVTVHSGSAVVKGCRWPGLADARARCSHFLRRSLRLHQQ